MNSPGDWFVERDKWRHLCEGHVYADACPGYYMALNSRISKRKSGRDIPAWHHRASGAC